MNMYIQHRKQENKLRYKCEIMMIIRLFFILIDETIHQMLLCMFFFRTA
jgi:hypothetical protein